MGTNGRNEISPATVWVGALVAWVLATVIVFVVFGPGEIISGSKAYGWHPQRCTVVSSSLAEGGKGQGELTVGVRYEFEGKSYETTCLLKDTVENLKRRMDVFMKPGEEVKCRVNPANPTEAMLDTAYIPFEFFMVLGISLTVICILSAAVWHVWIVGKRPEWIMARLAAGRVGMALACIFVLVFCGTATVRGFIEAGRMLATFGWTKTSATMEEASVTKERQGESWDYKVVLVYRYEFGGKEYRSSKWAVSDEGFSAGERRRMGAEAMKAGDVLACYVNPNKPDEAVLSRKAASYVGLFALPFILALAGWGLWSSIAPRRSVTMEAVLPEELEAAAASLRFPVFMEYELSRRQRLIPHIRIWTPQWMLAIGMLAISPYGIMKHWWFAAVPVIAVWYWRGFFIGLADVLLHARQRVEVALDREEVTVTSARTLIWAAHAGILSVSRLTSDVWTILYRREAVDTVPRWSASDEPVAVNIPVSKLSEDYVEYLRRVPLAADDAEDAEDGDETAT